MTRNFEVVLDWEEESRVWVAYVPALGNLSTFGESREEALSHAREAILGYLEAAAKEGIPIPNPGPRAERVELEVTVP
jgi:predicted RNase H-like HicB family nuclease